MLVAAPTASSQTLHHHFANQQQAYPLDVERLAVKAAECKTSLTIQRKTKPNRVPTQSGGTSSQVAHSPRRAQGATSLCGYGGSSLCRPGAKGWEVFGSGSRAAQVDFNARSPLQQQNKVWLMFELDSFKHGIGGRGTPCLLWDAFKLVGA